MTGEVVYILLGEEISRVDKRIDNLPKAFVPQGSTTFENLPATPTEDKLGYIWNITNEFTTDDRFIEGAGKKYPAGNNVAIIKHENNYYYDVMSVIDLSNYYVKSEVDAKISTEKSERITSDITLQNNIDTEVNARETAINTVNESIDQESITREQADTTLQNNINTEKTRAEGAESTLTTNLNAEIRNRADSDTILQNNIDIESTTRETADATLQTNIDAEATTRKSEDDKKVDRPNEPVSGQGVNVPYYFDIEYKNNKATVNDYTVDLLNKNKAAQKFSLDVNCATSSLAGLMSSSDKVNLDTINSDYLKSSDKTELEGKITSEETARTTADTVLQTNIDTEKTSRENADTALDERIKTFELPSEPEVKVIDNNNYLFANGVSIRIEDNTTENIAYYCTAEGVQKSITFPYQSIVHGGGLGTASRTADVNSTLVIINGGKVKSIYGGSRDYGNVGVSTVIVNGGTLKEGVQGGGGAAKADMVNSVGIANITFNGGTSLATYGGGMGLATVGKVNMIVNGGTHQWVTAGGSNGLTGSATVSVNGGNITCLQAVNRGTIQDVTMTINGGTITNVYGGGETGDSSVTGKCEKTTLHIEKSFGGHLNKGTYGGVEDASRVSGDYVESTITTAEAEACNLTLIEVPDKYTVTIDL